jgi:hypothetical protein
MPSIRSDNRVHESACASAEMQRQASMATATTAAQVSAVDIAFYRAIIASCKLNGLPYNEFNFALKTLGQ